MANTAQVITISLIITLSMSIKYGAQCCELMYNRIRYKAEVQRCYRYGHHCWNDLIWTENQMAALHCTTNNFEDIFQENQQYRNNYKSLIISNITMESLSQPFNLEWYDIWNLELSNLSISEIQPLFFRGFDSLKSLDLSKNNITKIPGGIFSTLRHLEILNISDNQEINESTFEGLSNLYALNLNGNRISIVQFSFIFTYLPQLEIFMCADNSISLINATSHGYINNIKAMDLSGNKLKNIDFIKFISNVTNLNLRNNTLESIPGNCFSSLDYLEYIDLSNNKLRDFKYISKSNNIEEIDLSSNVLQNIDLSNFTSNITKLNLSNNVLQTIPVNCFINLRLLDNLDLSNNNLTDLKYGLLNHLTRLQSLNLSNNLLNLDFHAISTLIDLREFRISGNRQVDLDVIAILNHFPQLSIIDLDQNKWNCKELSKIIHQFNNKGITVLPGKNYDDSNIKGIACTENLLDDKYNANGGTANGSTDALRLMKSFNQYLNVDFKDTNFSKYLENLDTKIDNRITDVESKLWENIYRNLSNIKHEDVKDNKPRDGSQHEIILKSKEEVEMQPNETDKHIIILNNFSVSSQDHEVYKLKALVYKLNETVKSMRASNFLQENTKSSQISTSSAEGSIIFLDIMIVIAVIILTINFYMQFRKRFTRSNEELAMV